MDLQLNKFYLLGGFSQYKFSRISAEDQGLIGPVNNCNKTAKESTQVCWKNLSVWEENGLKKVMSPLDNFKRCRREVVFIVDL